MGEYRSMLERVGGRVKPADDAFDRLERRRQRRQRNRRIATAVFAFVIAISGSFAAFEAFRGSNGSAAIGGTGPFYALWPELTLADAQQAQAAVDGGAGAWRLDARTTTGRFIALALGWSDFAVTVPDGTNLDGPGPVTLDVSTPPPPCPSPLPGTEGPMDCGPQRETVTLERLVRQDATGIWSVTDVEGAFPSSDNVLSLPFAPGDTVVSGQEVSIPFVVPDGLTAVAGYTYIGKCGSSTAFENVKQDNGRILLRVAGSTFKESCTSNGSGGSSASGPGGADLSVAIDGYVFVLASHGLDLASGWDPFTGGEPLPRDTSVVALAAVPVHFVPTPNAATAPDVAEVACDGATTQVLTPEVAAQPDGVHIRVTNTSSQDLSLDSKYQGDNAPVGVSKVLWPFPPGTTELRCMDPALDAGTSGGWVSLTVVDPHGYHVPAVLECAGGSAVDQNIDYAPDARGSSDPVASVEEQLSSVVPTRVVELAGYPEAEQPLVRVVVDGKIVSVLHFMSDGHGGWLMNQSETCGDTGIGGG